MPTTQRDYDADELYDEIFALAMQGSTDKEIAFNLQDKLGYSIEPSAFSKMIDGKYEYWSEEENERRGKRLRQVLARARSKINAIVRGRYLKVALGGIKVRHKSKVIRHLRIDGVITEDEEVQVTETEQELAPNAQALSTWLYHHDPEWRKVQRGEDTDDGSVVRATKGIDVESWIDKEMQQ